MAIVRWDPWADLFGIQRDLSDLFQRAYGDLAQTQPSRRSSAFIPPVDIFGRDGNLIVRAELPGVKPEEVEITVHNGVLTLRGDRKLETKVDEGSYFRMESSYGSFERQLQLPEGVADDQISATYQDGVLEVSIPRIPEVQPKKVHIAVGDTAAGSEVKTIDAGSEERKAG